MCLTAVMALSVMSIGAFANENVTPNEEVIVASAAGNTSVIEWNTTPSEWAENDVKVAAEMGILPQNIAGYIYPIDRENFCDILYALLCMDGIIVDQKFDTPFVDVDNVKISHLYNLGIVKGYEGDKFEPQKRISREETATILNRCLEYCRIEASNNTTHEYNDINKFSEWAKESIANLYSLKIMQGDNNNMFNPQNEITLEESIIAILRIHNYITN